MVLLFETHLMDSTPISTDDGVKYYYTTARMNAENVLGVIKAILQEYSIYLKDNPEDLLFKLYRTKEGYWYDIEYGTSSNNLLRTKIKKAIDECEKAKLLSMQ